MIALALTFLRSPLGKFAAIALAVILALWGVHHVGYSAGVKANEARHVKALEKAQKRVLEAEKQASAISARVGEKHAVTVEKIKWRTQVLKEEIKVYVPTSVDREYRLPDGLVRLHNAAASGAILPAAPGGSVEKPSDVAPSDLGSAITDNYGTCYVWQSEALTWRDWYVKQRDLWNATSRAKP